MKTFANLLNYGEEKTVKLNGKYVRGLARAVEGGLFSTAEILLMTDDSDESSEVRVLYAESGMMSDFIFFNMNQYLHNFGDLMDVIQFNYIYDGHYKTGCIIIAKGAEKKLLTELSEVKWEGQAELGLYPGSADFFCFLGGLFKK